MKTIYRVMCSSCSTVFGIQCCLYLAFGEGQRAAQYAQDRPARVLAILFSESYTV